MITVKKRKNNVYGHLGGQLVYEQVPHLGVNFGYPRSPDKDSGVHPVGYGHQKKRGSNSSQKTVSFRCQGENDDYEIGSSAKTQLFEKAACA